MTCRLLSMDIPALVILLSLAWTGPYMVAGQEVRTCVYLDAYYLQGQTIQGNRRNAIVCSSVKVGKKYSFSAEF